MCLGASSYIYADVPRLLARHRDAVPGIRRARVVTSQARLAYSRVLGGGQRERWRIGGVPYGTLLFCSPAEP